MSTGFKSVSISKIKNKVTNKSGMFRITSPVNAVEFWPSRRLLTQSERAGTATAAGFHRRPSLKIRGLPRGYTELLHHRKYDKQNSCRTPQDAFRGLQT